MQRMDKVLHNNNLSWETIAEITGSQQNTAFTGSDPVINTKYQPTLSSQNTFELNISFLPPRTNIKSHKRLASLQHFHQGPFHFLVPETANHGVEHGGDNAVEQGDYFSLVQ